MKIFFWILSILIADEIYAEHFGLKSWVKSNWENNQSTHTRIPGNGGIDSGGGDLVPFNFGSAWFLDEEVARSIKSCIVKNRVNFPLEDAVIIRNIQEAFSIWKEYIDHIDLYDDRIGEPEDSRLRMVTNISVSTECNGLEDLVFYLGEENEEIDKIRIKYNNPMAFTHRYYFDQEKGWSKGFIWITGKYAQNTEQVEHFYWGVNDNFKAILLHEIGHLLGVSHKRGTIMAENLVSFFSPFDLGSDFYFKKYMNKVDWTSILYNTSNFFNQNMVGGMWLPGTSHEKNAFYLIMDRPPQGNVQTQILVKEDQWSDDPVIYLGVKDDLEFKKFRIKFNYKQITLHEDVEKLFFRIRSFGNANASGTRTEVLGLENVFVSSLVGLLEKENGQIINILMENGFFNWILTPVGEPDPAENQMYINEGVFSIFAIDKGRKYFLFSNIVKLTW